MCLKGYSILNNKELDWFTSYLFNRTQQVVLDNVKSAIQHVHCGVPQGSILGPLLFLVFFNDFPEVLLRADIIQFADDTVIYFSSNNFHVIENVLNKELENVTNYFHDNDLVINLKKGKTESMLIGTNHKLKNVPSAFKLVYDCIEINQTSSYKKASGRLGLLYALKPQLDDETATTIYNTMVVRLITFNSIINLKFNDTQLKKLTSLDNRARNITKKLELNSIHNKILRNSCCIVRKCIDSEICFDFINYFVKQDHAKNTRNNKYMLKLPQVKLELAKNSFYFMGARIYNELPLHLRKEQSYMKFKNLLKSHLFF